MLVLVCYDVSTETKSGRRRLRRVAMVCESTGQRVQKSVFECQVSIAEFEALERRLLAEINIAEDSIASPRRAAPKCVSTANSRQWISTALWCCSEAAVEAQSATMGTANL